MGKRSNFERKPRDFYPTPEAAVIPLVPHLQTPYTFAEPCAGDGALIRHLEKLTPGRCVSATDIEPQHKSIATCGVLQVQYTGIDYIITNPPWDRKLLHPAIDHLASQIPTWLLFDADWMHTRQAHPYMSKCRKIVSIGRVKWFGGTTGKDNCAWYLFDAPSTKATQFYGRI